jgi:putative ABC transport system permease protein
MIQSVRERTEEFGVLKAMGFTNQLALAMVLAESCLIAVVGGGLGLGLAWLFTLGGSPAPDLLPIFILPARYLLIGLGLIMGLGMVAGILPALQAMRLRTAEALRRH